MNAKKLLRRLFVAATIGLSMQCLEVRCAEPQWMVDQTGCRILNKESATFVSLVWSGACKDGTADGSGFVQFVNKSGGVSRGFARYLRGELRVYMRCSELRCSENYISQEHTSLLYTVITDTQSVACTYINSSTDPCNGAILLALDAREEPLVVAGIGGAFKDGSRPLGGSGAKCPKDGACTRCEWEADSCKSPSQADTTSLPPEAQGKLLLTDFVEAVGKKDTLKALQAYIKHHTVGVPTPPAADFAAASIAHGVGLELYAQFALRLFFFDAKSDDPKYADAVTLYKQVSAISEQLKGATSRK